MICEQPTSPPVYHDGLSTVQLGLVASVVEEGVRPDCAMLYSLVLVYDSDVLSGVKWLGTVAASE